MGPWTGYLTQPSCGQTETRKSVKINENARAALSPELSTEHVHSDGTEAVTPDFNSTSSHTFLPVDRGAYKIWASKRTRDCLGDLDSHLNSAPRNNNKR